MNTIQFLAEWAVRSSVLILSGTLLLRALRVKNSSTRLAAWTAILCGSLAIPAMTSALPRVVLPVLRSPVVPVSAPMPTAFEPDAPLPASVDVRQVEARPTPFDWTRAALILYGVVAFALLLRLWVGLAISRRLLRTSRPTDQTTEGTKIRESDCVSAPVTLGIVRPAIVLPGVWSLWDGAKLDAVLAHERSHIRRHDPAVQLVSTLHGALLWFSPLTWFLHSRIVRVAEEVSDDAAVAVTRDPVQYAEVLLDFMKRAMPGASLVGVPMARYGKADQRIHRILDATSLSHGITRRGIAAIVAFGTPLAYVVASAHPQSPAPMRSAIAKTAPSAVVEAPVATTPETPVMIAQAAAPASAPKVVEARPKFDVASIRPCDPNAVPPGGRGGKSGGSTTRYRRNCVTVMSLIEGAYVRFADGKNRSPMLTVLTKIDGGPAWINSDQYTIEAEADGNFTPMMMDGPMMQTLLEDRFQLKVRRETREGPIYALTAAKGGSKIQSAREGPCVAADFVDSPFPFREPPPDVANMQCRFFWNARKGPNVVGAARSTTMEDLTAHLTRTMDRLVADKTGITGNVDFRLTYAPDESTPWTTTALPADGVPVAEDPAGPSIFTALQQQLGLRLEPARGARDYLVIDSVSRPSGN